MNVITRGRRSHRAANISLLLGAASFQTLAITAAQAQQQTAAPVVEEVLVTGSLIAGAAAVGVPVTAVSQQDVLEAGTVTLTQYLQHIPALNVMAEAASAHGGGRQQLGQNVQIHGIGTGDGVETLLMVNGVRFPPQNYAGETVDPSIVSQIGAERVDILTAGASAVYGSDATTGVINIILKRGYDGAMTQVRVGGSTDEGDHQLQVSQLYGRTWDGGDITFSYEYTDEPRVEASKRSYFTQNLEPYGLNDLTPIGASMPAVVSLGRPTVPTGAPTGAIAWLGTRYCGNCFAVPHNVGWDFGNQAPGPTTTWAQISTAAFVPFQANTQNQRNTWLDGWARPQMQASRATLTADQQITNDFFGLGPVSAFLDAFYSNRRSLLWWAPGNNNAIYAALSQYDGRNVNGMIVPTNNPYRPTGAPANLRVHYDFGPEIPMRLRGTEVAGRYAFGLNFNELPFEWRGRVYYSMTQDTNQGNAMNVINENHKMAALGNTIASLAALGKRPAQGAFTKPANIPYLNVFCNSTLYKCNSPETLQYIVGVREQGSEYKIKEVGTQIDGPLFSIPAGDVQAALAFQHLSRNLKTTDKRSGEDVFTTAFPETELNYDDETSYALFGQLNVPILGDGFNFPLAESLDVEVGYRYDKYRSQDEGIYTPKIALNWGVGYGLTLRGTWGKAFRAPSFSERANRSTGVITADLRTNCINPAGAPQGVALAGSVTAELNPTCSSAGATPLGLLVGGNGAGATEIIREHEGYAGLLPQSVNQWNIGFNFAPTEGILTGLNLDAQLFHMRFINLIANSTPGEGINDPASRSNFILPSDLGGQAGFDALIRRLAEFSEWGAGTAPDISQLTNVKYIQDNALSNIGWREVEGIDFNGRYAWDMGMWGAWEIGASGYYPLKDDSQPTPTVPVQHVYEGKNSGNRLQNVRYRLGWADGPWNATMFVNYRGHQAVNTDGNQVILPCYYAQGFTAGSCYPGSPYYGPFAVYPNLVPATVTFDLTFGYQTGAMPANRYLQNIGIQVTVNDVLNKAPPFEVGSRGLRRGTVRDLQAFSRLWSDRQRTVSIAVTKAW